MLRPDASSPGRVGSRRAVLHATTATVTWPKGDFGNGGVRPSVGGAVDRSLIAKRRWAKAYDRLIANLRKGSLAAGEFVSIPGLVELLDLVPKRGVLVVDASPKATRDCIGLRMMPHAEGTDAGTAAIDSPDQSVVARRVLVHGCAASICAHAAIGTWSSWAARTWAGVL